ncbi:MAG: hypothetical protein HRU03_09455, partial [Nanoarchaeales archaeon]|nr:hypothetical protein [Nanoarchaeales archaeon]
DETTCIQNFNLKEGEIADIIIEFTTDESIAESFETILKIEGLNSVIEIPVLVDLHIQYEYLIEKFPDTSSGAFTTIYVVEALFAFLIIGGFLF